MLGQEKSPITGEYTVIVDVDPQTGVVSKLCTQSGFVTNSYLKKDSEELEKFKESMPQVSIHNIMEDDLGAIWVPMMQSTDKGVIFPSKRRDSESLDDFVWVVAPIFPLPDVELDKYTNPENPGGYMDSYVSFDDSITFEKEDFSGAFDKFLSMSKGSTILSEDE